MADVAVALLGGASPALAQAVADHTGGEVATTTRDDHVTTVVDLASRHELVVGMARTPWPQHADLHETTARAAPAYRGVVAWHVLPRLLDALADAAAPGAAAGAHLLVTSPDPGAEAGADEVVFLREVAEEVAGRLDGASTSIAWRGTTRDPTVTAALTALAEVHGQRDVVEVHVAPGAGVDATLLAAADPLGMRVTTVDLATATLVACLADVAATVTAHEQPDPEQVRDVAGDAP